MRVVQEKNGVYYEYVVYADNLKGTELFRSKDAHDAINWAIDHTGTPIKLCYNKGR